MQIVRGRAAALGAAALCAVHCGDPVAAPVYQAIAIERRDIVVSAEAAGVVEPDVTVEVKSKASGEILELFVETGDIVEQGAPLLRIDRRQPRNTLAEARADLEVARARLANGQSQQRRAEKLFKAQSMSQAEYDQAVLDTANARAEVVRAEVAVENAQIQLDDTDVRAPGTGTVIEKSVERGQVISSPTRDVAGGTVLLRMADLNRVRVRALVDETDIGKVAVSMPVTVVAAAYPQRPFHGEVLKIEPQAVTEQNVTMFAVLVGVDNRGGALRPGMNCEVEVHVGSREGVLAVPNAALRTRRDVASAAQVLGLDPDAVQESLSASAGTQGTSVATPPGATPVADGGTHSSIRPPADADNRQRTHTAGDRYIVFALRDDVPVPVEIQTGLTDLDHSEVLSGLVEGDAVLILPSAGLVRAQERFRERIQRVRGDGLPGVRRRER